MDGYATLIFLFFGCSLSSCSKFPLPEYYYVNLLMNWTDAQDYCRVHYTDLATLESMDDINRLKADFSYNLSWVGLSRDPNSRRWSATVEANTTGFHAWAETEPNHIGGNENCVLMSTNRQWRDYSCDRVRTFVCYTVTNQNDTTYVFIPTPGTWNFAQEYCGEHHTDLAVIRTAVENDKVFSVKPPPAQVWIGPHRVRWTWADSSQSSFRNWKADEPENCDGDQLCAAENDLHEWIDTNCQNKNTFICHQVAKLRTVVRLTTETNADMTDPAIQAQILQQVTSFFFKLFGRCKITEDEENDWHPIRKRGNPARFFYPSSARRSADESGRGKLHSAMEDWAQEKGETLTERSCTLHFNICFF
uniref:C-type lectin domain-containing protein n=2 Tax=Scophthalmus maximus TaxID=52904 RepID=A0A8D3BLP9_SCOMX